MTALVQRCDRLVGFTFKHAHVVRIALDVVRNGKHRNIHLNANDDEYNDIVLYSKVPTLRQNRTEAQPRFALADVSYSKQL
jgi:hypothetical protein